MRLVGFGRIVPLRFLVALAIVALAAAQVGGSAPPVSAQGTATIEITNIDTGTGQTAPFTRFKVTSENGTVYGPMETDLNGYVAFSVIVDPQGTRFTIEEETPPACTPVPDPQTTEPLTPGDSASFSFSTQDVPDCGLGTIALYAMVCPEGFSGPADDYAPWRDGCTGTNDGTPFTIASVETGQAWHPVAGAYGIPGRAPIVGLPAGDYTFQQDDGTPAAVFCLVYDTSNYATSPAPSSVLPVALENGVGTIALTGNRVSCDLFTVPGGTQPELPVVEVEPVSSASLDVHLATCSQSELANGTFYDVCHGNGISGQSVHVSSDTGYAGTIATTMPQTPGPGVASFTGLPAGTFTVTTSVPDGSDVFVYCTDAEDTQIPASFDDASRSLTLDIVGGEAITCDWYEVAAEISPAGGTAFLELHAVLCPDGTAPESNLYDACHANGMADAAFTAAGPNGFFDQQTTAVPNVPGPGVVTFANLAGGTYTLTQQSVDPSWIVTMYCSLAEADDVVPFTQSGQGGISLTLPIDTGVVCDFYNIPPADLATTLQVVNYTCPMGTPVDASTPLATLEATCTVTLDGIDVTLAPLGQQGSILESGSGGPGTVLFEGLPSGAYSLSNSIPGDFNTPWAFCGIEGGPLQPLTWLQGGDPLQIDAAAGTYLCKWFNNPENASGYSDTLTVTAYLCPPGTTTRFGDRCGASPLSGATFELSRARSGDRYSGVTDELGDVVFERLIPGDYTLTSIPPAGTNVAVYVVSCQAGEEIFDFTYDDANGMRIRLALPGGVDISCAWYNVPPGQPAVTPGQASGSITVHKFLCQGKAIASYNWEADCSAQTIAAGFSLKTADGRPIAVGTIDAQGVLTFTQLANGAYQLNETTGNWCHAEADRVDSAGNVLVSGGTNTDVFIYNCSVKQVDLLPSTGTGVARPTAAVSSDSGWLGELALAAGATLALALVARNRLQHAAAIAELEEHARRRDELPDEAI